MHKVQQNSVVSAANVESRKLPTFFYLTAMRAKHGGVPKAATGLSEAREAAERQRAPERAFHDKCAPS